MTGRLIQIKVNDKRDLDSMKTYQLIIVDDQRRSRESLRAFLATWPAVGSIREAENGLMALTLLEEHQPDLVLMDVRMPEMDGISAARQIKERWPQVKIIALSLYPDSLDEARQAGADACISKAEAPEKLLSIIETIFQIN